MADSKNTGQPEDKRPIPDWIDAALLQQALRNGGEENSQVTDISVSYATSPGDNYGSTIYRAKATLSDGGQRSFIVKGPAPGANISSLATDLGVFRRETLMLAEVIPKMEALLEAAAPGRYPPLAPRCYHHGTSPVEFLVLEDLAPPGFKMADRKRGLGLKHSLLALRTLARFHAASYTVLQREPGLAEKLDNIWRTMSLGLTGYVDALTRGAVEVCRSWPGFEEYAERLEKFKKVAMDTYVKLNEPQPGAFNVITHGDYWIINFLFRYEDGVPTDIRALDYQAPPLEALRSALDFHGPFSLFVALAKPILVAERGNNTETMMTGDHSQLMPLYQHPDVEKWLQRVIPDYARRGWLPELS
ncbi:CSON013154 protein [Gryllus bimaculatus]|nr:CSON013154 protein [Gryllus bimaculatus]